MTNLSWHTKRVAKFCDQHATVQHWIEYGKNAINWTRPWCHSFGSNEERL